MASLISILWLLTLLNNFQIVYEPTFKVSRFQLKAMHYLQEAGIQARLGTYMPLLLGQIQVESSWRLDARNSLGCIGAMQFCPRWNKEFFSRSDALDYRAQVSEYLRRIKERLSKGYSIQEAIVAHFSPQCAVRGFTKACWQYWRKIQKNAAKFKAKLLIQKKL